jgi:hypothetical protein
LSGCFSEKKPEQDISNITKFELLKYAKLVDPKYELLMPNSDKDVIHCSHYFPPCNIAFKVKLYNLPAIVLEYNNYQDAKLGAKKIRGFLFHNWVFDDVTDEPILLKQITKVFKDGESFRDYGK